MAALDPRAAVKRPRLSPFDFRPMAFTPRRAGSPCSRSAYGPLAGRLCRHYPSHHRRRSALAGPGRRARHSIRPATAGWRPRRRSPCRRSRLLPRPTPKARRNSGSPAPTRTRTGGSPLAELVEPRRKAFAKLDVNWRRQVEFRGMGGARRSTSSTAPMPTTARLLTPAEYATTAPKPRPKKRRAVAVRSGQRLQLLQPVTQGGPGPVGVDLLAVGFLRLGPSIGGIRPKLMFIGW